MQIEVEDIGIAIASNAQACIFEPFVQLSHRNARRGSCLGLAICRQFAQMMVGTIQVESEQGSGSIFRVELFAAPADEYQAGCRLEEIDTAATCDADQPQFRIPVIEGDLTNRLLLKQVLEGAGFQTRTAKDGKTGVGVFCEWHRHFIWLDIHLPALNGDAKFAALTASVFDEEPDTILAANLDDFVRKPFRANTVFASMERLLGPGYVRSAPSAGPLSDSGSHGLAQVATLPDDVRWQPFSAILLLEKQRVTEVIHSVPVDPPLRAELSRLAENFEFTPIMRGMQSEEAA